MVRSVHSFTLLYPVSLSPNFSNVKLLSGPQKHHICVCVYYISHLFRLAVDRNTETEERETGGWNGVSEWNCETFYRKLLLISLVMTRTIFMNYISYCSCANLSCFICNYETSIQAKCCTGGKVHIWITISIFCHFILLLQYIPKVLIVLFLLDHIYSTAIVTRHFTD